jgi:hypothetical protein
MSIPVALDALRTEMGKYRPSGYLLTAGEGAPHVVSVVPEWNGDQMETTCGRRTATNAERQPSVALLFSPIDDGDYSLIVDATATARLDGEQWYVSLTPSKAVLHRNATPDSPTSVTGCGNDCVPL